MITYCEIHNGCSILYERDKKFNFGCPVCLRIKELEAMLQEAKRRITELENYNDQLGV
jgi:hypothetical protein